jgi:lipoprotein-anchoring transpeptidase ErfK/SrfK
MTRPAAGAGLAVAVLAAAGCLGAPAPAAASTVPASQPLVVLLSDHVARAEPRARARRLESVDARRPLTGVRTVLPVLGDARHPAGEAWVRVRMPGRPNGHTGWIRAERTRRTATAWHLVLDLSARRVIVYRSGRTRHRFLAVVGKPSTPTPRGAFFIEEGVALPSHTGGPFALATSARSNVLQQFEGGPGQIALHGTYGLAGAPGTAASHGCIRLRTRAITWLAAHVGTGVPLTIRR